MRMTTETDITPRDYYPWWHPSPWIDVAVLTNDATNASCTAPGQVACSARCEYYLKNSFNKHVKGYCDVKHDGTDPVTRKTTSTAWNNNVWYNNEVIGTPIQALKYLIPDPNRKHVWRTIFFGSRWR
jgi:hypothetical protein